MALILCQFYVVCVIFNSLLGSVWLDWKDILMSLGPGRAETMVTQKYVGRDKTKRKNVFCTFCLDFIHFGLPWLFVLYIHYLFVHLIWKPLNVFANLLAAAPPLSLFRAQKKKIRQSWVAVSEVRGQWGAVASAHQKRATWCQNCSPPLPPLPPSMADCKPVNTEEGGVRCVWVCEGVYGGVVGAGLNV